MILRILSLKERDKTGDSSNPCLTGVLLSLLYSDEKGEQDLRMGVDYGNSKLKIPYVKTLFKFTRVLRFFFYENPESLNTLSLSHHGNFSLIGKRGIPK